MDDDLRAHERAARADPADLVAARAHAEAERRRGDHRACFATLARLARLGDVEARREVAGWAYCTRPFGTNGTPGWRSCAPVDFNPRFELCELPAGCWELIGAIRDRLALRTVPTWDTALTHPVECVRVGVDDLRPEALMTLPIGTRDLDLHGEDLVWRDGTSVRVAGVHDELHATLPVSAIPPHVPFDEGIATPLWDRWLLGWSEGGSATAKHRIEVVDSLGRSSWTRSTLGRPIGAPGGRPTVKYVVDNGVPFDPAQPDDILRWRTNVLEGFAAEDGADGPSSAPLVGDPQLEGWDGDEGLLSLEWGARLELREASSWGLRWGVDAMRQPSAPRPVLAPDAAILVDRLSDDGIIRAIERRTGRERWSSAIHGARRASTEGSYPDPGALGGLACARGVAYVAVERDDDVIVRGHDLTSGELMLEVRLPLVAKVDFEHYVRVRPLYLVPFDRSLVVIANTAQGGRIARIR